MILLASIETSLRITARLAPLISDPRNPAFGIHGRPEVMVWCETNDVDYIVGLPGNKVLDRLVEPDANNVRVCRPRPTRRWLHFGAHHAPLSLPFTDPIERLTVREIQYAAGSGWLNEAMWPR